MLASMLDYRNKIDRMMIIQRTFLVWWLPMLLILMIQPLSSYGRIAKPGCPEKCGEVEVPYPFGIDNPNCARNQSYLLICNHTTSTTSPILQNMKSETISNISLENGTITIKKPHSFASEVCLDRLGTIISRKSPTNDWSDGPFTVAGGSRNKFTAVGCNNLARLSFITGCVSFCFQDPLAVEDFQETMGYCQAMLVPNKLKNYFIYLERAIDQTDFDYPFLTNRHCIYGFLVDATFNLSSTVYAAVTQNKIRPVPVVLEWVVGENCSSSTTNADHACIGGNTQCYDSDSGGGYRCYCKSGYQGNPYIQDGCQDINECEEKEKYPCHGSCRNTKGNYTCRCPLGMHGDGKVRCEGIRLEIILLVIGSAISTGIVIFLTIILWKKRIKEKNFMKHGGAILHNHIKFFKEEELKKATNNYSHLLGEGGFGSVYKGEFNNVYIAVKKPKEVNAKTEINQQFELEISIISQVNHKNVVKLLGMCLETKIPMLVYEFVPNGTVFEHIHKKKSTIFKSWRNCLRVAEETASALNYLHSLADPPIIHRDVKSINILLDSKNRAKVSDFGASVLVPPGQSGTATTVQGTFGYLDPEYLRTGTLTAKSDVYSFGVVLIELLTGLNPIPNYGKAGGERNVIQYFISAVENKSIYEILNVEVTDEGEEEQIEKVAELAVKCLGGNRASRPSMKEVADILGMLMKLLNGNLQEEDNSEETESLLFQSSASDSNPTQDTITTYMDSQDEYIMTYNHINLRSISTV